MLGHGINLPINRAAMIKTHCGNLYSFISCSAPPHFEIVFKENLLLDYLSSVSVLSINCPFSDNVLTYELKVFLSV